MPEKVLYDEVHSERGMYECIIYSFLTFPVSFGPGKAVAVCCIPLRTMHFCL